MHKMTIKAFFIGCSNDVFTEMVISLQKDYNWDIQYWTTNSIRAEKIRKELPQTLVHPVIDAIRGIPPNQLEGLQTTPVDAELIAKMAPYETVAMHMMDRIGSGSTFTYHERWRQYCEYLGYWYSVLTKYSPDLVFFPLSPHAVYDYVVYGLCRMLGIQTLMFENPLVFPGLLFLVDVFEDGLKDVSAAYQKAISNPQSLSPAKISPAAMEYVDRVRKTYEKGKPKLVAHHLRKADRYLSATTWKSLATYLVFPWRIGRLLRNGWDFLFATAREHYFPKKPNIPLARSTYSGIGWRVQKTIRRHQKNRLRKYYNQLAEPCELDDDFIFVALHFQPERTTSPMGGIYTDQLLMIELLSSCLPTGWKLYVKEAPTTFFPHITKLIARSKEFYDEICAVPNTKLVPVDADPFEYIDRAKAVATITGTIGWESVLRGKPCLVFGMPWYQACEGVYHTPDREKCLAAIGEIQKGIKIEEASVLRFIQVLESLGISAFTDQRFKPQMPPSDQENIDILCNALNKFAKSHNLTN
jgi:hypothetical protein